MGVFQNNLMGAAAAAASAGGGDFYTHQIANSVRNSFAQNGTMLRTPGTPSSTTTMTLSMWVKRHTAFPYASGDASEGNRNLLFTSGSGSGYVFITTDNPGLTVEVGGVGYLTTNALLRDTNAFYHIVLRVDTTQASTANRLRLYINGVEPTYLTISAQNVTQNSAFPLLASGVVQGIGGVSGVGHTTIGTDTTFAEVVFNDGQSYGPDSYGETKNGVWIPKDPSGLTFGDQGFHLNFASSGDLGNDVSGNNNDFTIADISAHDQLLSSPTFNSSSNGGNFNTYNPLTAGSYISLSEGNLQTIGTNVGDEGSVLGTMGVTSGKWYWEVRMISMRYSVPGPGISAGSASATQATTTGGPRNLLYYAGNSSNFLRDFNSTIWGTVTEVETGLAGFSAGDKMMIALDVDNKKVWYGKNGSWFNSGNPATGTNPQQSWTGTGFSINPSIQEYDSSSSSSSCANFGQDGTFAGTETAQGNSDDTGYGNFYYDPPTGFLAMCSGNLPTADAVDPAQTDDDYPQKLFAPTLYTGDGASTLTISGMDFQPDWTWIKAREDTSGHKLFDSTRGVTKYVASDSSALEVTASNTLKSWTSDGFTLGDESGVNTNTNTYASWNWRANGGSDASNATGDITSTVQADPSGCFSIVTYTGSGTAGDTIGHGLSVAPNMIMIKNRSSVDSWAVYHSSLGNTIHLVLDTYAAQVTSSAYWNSTSPTSSVFTVGTGDALNQSTKNYVAFCFANCEGYSKSGSYIGNGNADGSFVYTGFRPAWIMCKRTDSSSFGNWRIMDDARSPFNVGDKSLLPNSSAGAEDGVDNYVDLLSNGFKVRNTQNWNSSAGTYVYLAFAENPFQYATAR